MRCTMRKNVSHVAPQTLAPLTGITGVCHPIFYLFFRIAQ